MAKVMARDVRDLAGLIGSGVWVRPTGLREAHRRFVATGYVDGRPRYRYGETPDEARAKVERLFEEARP